MSDSKRIWVEGRVADRIVADGEMCGCDKDDTGWYLLCQIHAAFNDGYEAGYEYHADLTQYDGDDY